MPRSAIHSNAINGSSKLSQNFARFSAVGLLK